MVCIEILGVNCFVTKVAKVKRNFNYVHKYVSFGSIMQLVICLSQMVLTITKG